jgi:hypothetical protein
VRPPDGINTLTLHPVLGVAYEKVSILTFAYIIDSSEVPGQLLTISESARFCRVSEALPSEMLFSVFDSFSFVTD